MMSDIPQADVIVNNPTHYSIALCYKEGGMVAPTMLAKGAGDIALRIREEGLKHGIPMLEAPHWHAPCIAIAKLANRSRPSYMAR